MYHAAVVRGTPTQEELKRRSVQAFMMTTEPLPEDPEDIPQVMAIAMRKRRQISSIVSHEWKLKLNKDTV